MIQKQLSLCLDTGGEGHYISMIFSAFHCSVQGCPFLTLAAAPDQWLFILGLLQKYSQHVHNIEVDLTQVQVSEYTEDGEPVQSDQVLFQDPASNKRSRRMKQKSKQFSACPAVEPNAKVACHETLTEEVVCNEASTTDLAGNEVVTVEMIAVPV